MLSNFSQEIKDAVLQGALVDVRLTIYGVDDEISVTSANIAASPALTIDRHSASSNHLEFGSVSAADLSLTLTNYNNEFSNFKLEGAEIYVELLIPQETLEGEAQSYYVIPYGYYTIDNLPRKQSLINITALDRMVLFDKEVDWSLMLFPMTVGELITTACNVCNVELGTDIYTLVNQDYVVEAQPDISGAITYRQLIMWCSQICGVCAYINNVGKLMLRWYESTDEVIDATTRIEGGDIHENDIVITGVEIIYADSVTTAGTSEYTIQIVNNPLITSNSQTIADNLYGKVFNLRYRPFETSILSLPWLEPLDMFNYRSADGSDIPTLITHANFSLAGTTGLKAIGETTVFNGYASSNPLTASERRIIETIKKEMNTTLNDRVQTIIEFNKLITNSMGLYFTSVTDDSGASISYMHDAPLLENSTTIYTLTANGFAFTNSGWNNGSPAWVYGFSKDGNAIFRNVSAYGLEVSNPNTKYSAKVTPEAFETFFGEMLTSSFNGTQSIISQMKVIQSADIGKVRLIPAVVDGTLVGADLIFVDTPI